MTKVNRNIKFLEDIAIADVAYLARGKTLEETFQNCAIALFASMADIDAIALKIEKKFSKIGKFLDNLLYDFLDELLLFKDVDNLLFSKFDVEIERLKAKSYKLSAICLGEKMNPKKHKITTDIKAITMHMFKLEKTKDGYEARVVVDI